MKNNMGVIDRCIRFVLALVFIMLYATRAVVGTWGIVLLAFAAIFILTSFIGTSPLYLLFKIDTRSHSKRKETGEHSIL
jgi:O-antigen/teichoic acid export membrane protein